MRSPTLTEVGGGLLLVSMPAWGLADALATVAIGPATLQALLTAASAALPGLLWCERPSFYLPALLATLPLILLAFLGAASLAWGGVSTSALQNLLVLVAFVGSILASSHCARTIPAFSGKVLRATILAGGVSLVFYEIITPLHVTEPFVVTARPFALFALIPAACFLASGRQGASWGLPMALVTTAAIAFSLSRMALASAVALFPVSQLFRDRGGWQRFGLIALLAAGVAVVVSSRSPELLKRFLEGDTAIRVGGVGINAEGRTVMWQTALHSYAESPWIGKGVGSVGTLMASTFNQNGAEVIEHPHCDYLRLLHDYGLLGLGLWILGCIRLLQATWTAWRDAARHQDETAAVHMAAFLSLVAVSLTMSTDNSLIYVFVMAPLGILLGASLGSRKVGEEEPS